MDRRDADPALARSLPTEYTRDAYAAVVGDVHAAFGDFETRLYIREYCPKKGGLNELYEEFSLFTACADR